jgi:hypothetical protein
MNKKYKITILFTVAFAMILIFSQMGDKSDYPRLGKNSVSNNKKLADDTRSLRKNNINERIDNTPNEHLVGQDIVGYEETLLKKGFKRWKHGGDNEFVYRKELSSKKFTGNDVLKLTGFKRKDFFPVVVYNSVAMQNHLLAQSATQQCYISFQVYDEKELYYDDKMTTLGFSEFCLNKNMKSLKIKTRCTDSTPLMFQRYEEW